VDRGQLENLINALAIPGTPPGGNSNKKVFWQHKCECTKLLIGYITGRCCIDLAIEQYFAEKWHLNNGLSSFGKTIDGQIKWRSFAEPGDDGLNMTSDLAIRSVDVDDNYSCRCCCLLLLGTG
jgi:hypothetical protein